MVWNALRAVVEHDYTVARRGSIKKGHTMEGITTVGLDLAKNVFQAHAVNAVGEVIVRRALRRAQVLAFFEKLPPCLVGMEACGSAHYWAQQIGAMVTQSA